LGKRLQQPVVSREDLLSRAAKEYEITRSSLT
jgi:hypothetical protein